MTNFEFLVVVELLLIVGALWGIYFHGLMK